MKTLLASTLAAILLATATASAAPACPTEKSAQKSSCPLDGSRWALTIPSGAAGWIGFSTENGTLTSLLLWGGGHPLPAPVTIKEDKSLEIRRAYKSKQKDGKELDRTDLITAKLNGASTLALEVQTLDASGKPINQPAAFTGTRIPDLPPTPDLSKLTYGKPVSLIGKDLSNWEAMNPAAYNGWTIKDGVLTNTVVFPNGTKVRGTNLCTADKSFKNFRLTFDVNMAPKGNSGVYLRGIYEIQMADTGHLAPHYQNMGALYGRVAPSSAVEKKPGEWQTVDITLVDRHVTVILNGIRIIDNQPALGCTGGAITSNEFIPGPIYLQGDHTNASYRNMILTPIVGDLR